MSGPFTSNELRAAARQATKLALSSWCPQVRKSLLESAERLSAEADANDRSDRKMNQDNKPVRTFARAH
jgi:hypothetical protein